MKSSLLHLPRVRRVLGRDAAWPALWLASAAGLEVFGRWSRNDTTDTVGVLGVLTLALVTWREHRQRPLRPVRVLAEHLRQMRESRLGKRWTALRFRTGIDLRGDPPLPRATPRVFAGLVVGVGLVAALLALGAELFPTRAREVLGAVSGAAYLLLLTGLWSLLGAMTLVGVVLPVFLAREAIHHSLRWRGERARTRKAAVTVGYLTVLLLCMSSGPTWVPLAVLVGSLGLALALGLVAARSGLDLLWKSTEPDAQPAVMSWTAQALTQAWMFAGGSIALVLATTGDRLGRGGSSETALTALLGHGFAWASAGVFVVLVADLALAVYAGRRRNPGVPVPTRVRVEGADGRAERELARRALGEAGFRVAFEDAARDPLDVRVRLREPGAPAPEPVSGSTWPLPVAPEELEEAALHERLRRQSEILRRRKLLRGLERLFKAVPRRAFRRGTGTWIAPHFWFITRMSRDVEEEDELLSGPPYHPTLPLGARAHLYEVLRAVEIDIVFVEDGVHFRRLKRVFRMLFEYYDVFGGERAAEERQFAGLPGVRVVIHEYDLDRPLLSTSYPEPDYEDLGRARILHVFRDRGGDASDAPVPADADLRPEPVGLA